MASRRSEHIGVKLGCDVRTPLPDRAERGPWMADDHGVAIVVGRRWFSKVGPRHYYFFAWAEVKSYRLATPTADQASGPAPVKATHSRLTFYTRSDVYSWELPMSQTQVRTRPLGR